MSDAMMVVSTEADEAAIPEFMPLQVHDVALAGRALIEASAGTGKTFNITGLYARLILGASIAPGAPSYDASKGLLPEGILVVTFTKAATAELKERIRLRLAQLTQTFVDASPALVGGKPEPFCAEVWQRVCDEGLDAAALLARLRLALATLDQAAISTIHSFCQRLLSEQAFEAGFDFDRILLEDESEVLAEITQDYWRSRVYGASKAWVEYLYSQKISLNHLQQSAALQKNINPADILPLPAASDVEHIAQRWQGAVARCRDAWNATTVTASIRTALSENIFTPAKAKSLEIVADSAWIIEIEHFFSHADDEIPDVFALLKSSYLASAVSAAAKKKGQAAPEHAFFSAVEDLYLTQKTAAADRALCLQHWLLDFGVYVRQELQIRKAQAGVMSFDDSINFLAAALDNPNRAAHLAAKVSQKYQAALVDEFQDTDPLQFKIIDSLFGQALLGGAGEEHLSVSTIGGRQPPFFMVGDPKQAIYAFRGADVYAYLGARRGSVERPVACYSIDTNYRSDAAIVKFVNALFAPKTAFVESKIQHPDIKSSHSGESKFQSADDRGPVHAFVFDGEKPELAEKKLFAAVSDEIAALLTLAREGRATLQQDEATRALSPSDIAVLVPSHRQAHEMKRALAKRGVAAVMQTRESVFASNEAQGLYAILAAIEAPAQTALLRKALISSVMGLSVADLMALQLDDAAWQTAIENLQQWRDEWRKSGFMPMFRRWLVDADVAQRLLAGDDGERALTNLLHVAELLQHESQTRTSPALLLAWLARQITEPNHGAEGQQMRLESDADRVRLVTIHASKGLEYPVVFCPFSWKGKSKLLRNANWVSFHDENGALKIDIGTPDLAEHVTQAETEAYAEQIRLLYVAVTRAKHRLYLAFPAFETLAWQSVTGIKNAPLSNVLLNDAGEPLREHVKSLNVPTLTSAFQRLLPEVLTVSDIPPSCVLSAAQHAEQQLIPALDGPSQRLARAPWSLAAPWRLASFSSLTRSHGASEMGESIAELGVDHDRQMLSVSDRERAANNKARFRFVRGSKAGTTLHGILEHEDFCRMDAALLTEQVSKALLNAGLSDEAPEQVADWLLDVLAAPINLDEAAALQPEDSRVNQSAPVFRLNQLSTRQRLNEWPFLLGCESLDLTLFCRVLAQPQWGVDPRFIAAAQRIKPEKFQGYLNGVVDLIFYWQGQYFIADYKSNHLGDDFAAYAADALSDTIADAHYYLQYLLYACAWHRYMQARVGAAYDYERDFGGVLYLFIRGMSTQALGGGVYFNKPPVGLIAALNTALGNGAEQ